MKNNNEKLKATIAACGFGAVMFISGTVFGSFSATKNQPSSETTVDNNTTTIMEMNEELVDEYLDSYISKRDSLEKEIENLIKKRDALKNCETFDLEDLIVIENFDVNNESQLYILKGSVSSIYHEYHGDFEAWYRLHDSTDDHKYDTCPKYVHFDDGQPLFNYLTDEEIEAVSQNNGKITTFELDDILARIRAEYQEQKNSDNTK